jgi:glutamate racemase
VQAIEAGELHAQKTRRILEDALEPLLTSGIDTVVLGCTHYPFAIPIIESIVGPGVRVIDPAPAVARQVRRVWETRQLNQEQRVDPAQPDTRATRFFTSGNPNSLEPFLRDILKVDVTVEGVNWENGELVIA